MNAILNPEFDAKGNINGEILDVEKRIGDRGFSLATPHDNLRKRLQDLVPPGHTILFQAAWFAPPAEEIGAMGVLLTAARGTLALQSQRDSDGTKLDNLLPRDQTRAYTARWDRATPQEIESELTRLSAMSDKQLLILAHERGVVWDKSAGPTPQTAREAMVQRLAPAGARLVFGEPAAGEVPPGPPAVVDPIDREVRRLRGLSTKDLRTLAAERHVKWENDASLDTMLRRLAEAELPEADPEGDDEPGGAAV